MSMWLWTAHTAAMLPPRLVLVHDMVPSCSVVADVGCDHGLLGTALLLSGKAQRIIAADVNKLAMERATLVPIPALPTRPLLLPEVA